MQSQELEGSLVGEFGGLVATELQNNWELLNVSMEKGE